MWLKWATGTDSTMTNLGRSKVSMINEVDAIQFTTVLIGRQLKVMREQAGLSQVEVARKARTRPEMLSRLEHGRGNPTVKLVERIVKAIQNLAG